MKNLMLLLLLGAVPLGLNAQTTSPAKAPAAQATPADEAAARAEMADLQKQLGELSKRMAEVSMKMGGNGPKVTAMRYLASPNKAMVGLMLAESELGVRVGAVTPDGPAAQAGMKSGDIITRVQGKNIATGDAAKALQQTRDALAELTDGNKVEIGYMRDGKPAKASVTAARREAVNSYRLLADGEDLDIDDVAGMDGNVKMIVKHIGDGAADGIDDEAIKERVIQTLRERGISDAGRTRVEIHRLAGGMPWWGINLAELNPDLGRYFGTDQGVLVLSNDGGALGGVKSGDVIQQVAGNKVRRPEDALRRLRDQPADSEVAMQLLRERKAMTLSVRVPDNQSMFDMMPPPPPPPPAPAAPSAPTSASAPPAPPAPVAPAVPGSAPAAKAVSASDSDAPATIAAVVASPALLSRVVSPGAAAKGGAVGSPGLWGGRIRSVKSNADSTCYIVAATTLGNDGKPVRGDFRNDTFSACTVEPLDTTQFVGGRYATFLGTITDRTQRYEGFPTIIVTDATAWSTVPDMPRSPQPSPPPPYRF